MLHTKSIEVVDRKPQAQFTMKKKTRANRQISYSRADHLVVHVFWLGIAD